MWRSKPTQNAFVESFNGKLRDELLAREAFDTLLEAKVLIERWRQHYNTIRPHSALGYRPPAPEEIAPPAGSASLATPAGWAAEYDRCYEETGTISGGKSVPPTIVVLLRKLVPSLHYPTVPYLDDQSDQTSKIRFDWRSLVTYD